MTAKELAAAAVVGAAVVIAVIDLTGTEKAPQAGDVPAEPSKLAALPDGGLAYVQSVKVADGGVELRKLLAPDCVRRRANAPTIACRRLIQGVPTDFGDMNRFPADASVGLGCQPVACSVVAGEDPEAEESDRLSNRRDAGK